MTVFLAAMLLLAGSGFVAVLAGRWPRAATALGAGGSVAACAMALVPAVNGLYGSAESVRWAWQVPGGSFYVQIDALSAFFLIPILGLSLLTAVYGTRYTLEHETRRSAGGHWFFFSLLVAGMAMVVVARNAVLFLMAWEVMSIASFFLVTLEHDKPEVRHAGWTYLVATHLGTAFLIALFGLMGSDSLDFDRFSAAASPSLLFALAVVGFGTKAGFFPLHVWLPEAHPAAPSHVSALMSGVMIKTGIYGLLRIMPFIGPPAAWWGWTLVAIGFVSGVAGVAFALAQHDIKRLLAYHSVENIGIIALGLGLGLLGLAYDMPVMAILGFTGGLLHVANHALFKGLLFLGAGAAAHSAGTREMDRLGGLLKRMPWTGASFLVGASAISGLPPLNGFVSELLIYLGAYEGLKVGRDATLPAIAVIGGLALIGGLAAACFAKVAGIAFLGEPRSLEAARATEASRWMILPMLVLTAGCVAMGLGGALAVRGMGPVIGAVSGLDATAVAEQLAPASAILLHVTIVSGSLAGAIVVLAALRWAILRGRNIEDACTWDCGYAQPTSRMQYTASSFAQPLTSLFRFLLRPRKDVSPPAGVFPAAASFESHTSDVARQRVFAPIFRALDRVAAATRILQHGRVNLYVLYIAATLIALLAWALL